MKNVEQNKEKPNKWIGHQKGKEREREREREVAADQINQRIKNNQNNYDN